MYTITKEFHFSAAHTLNHLHENHPCSKMHGHNYKVIVELQTDKLNENGFVKDYRELDEFKKFIDEHLDHKNLNDFFGDGNTTSEKMAAYIFNEFKFWFPELSAITISETDKTFATYRP